MSKGRRGPTLFEVLDARPLNEAKVQAARDDAVVQTKPVTPVVDSAAGGPSSTMSKDSPPSAKAKGGPSSTLAAGGASSARSERRSSVAVGNRTQRFTAADNASDDVVVPLVPNASPPFLSYSGACVHLSFTTKRAAFALFGVVVAAAATYMLGDHFGSKDGYTQGFAEGQNAYKASAVDEITAARGQPPASDVIEGLLIDNDNDSKTNAVPGGGNVHQVYAGPSPSWVRGHTYIVAQEFKSGEGQDAVKAQEFLLNHGISAEIVPLPSGGLQLITTQGYKYSDTTQRQLVEQLHQQVRDLGEKYFASGGRHRLEGYLKTLKHEAW